jgi:hypothetical protein
VSCRWWKAKLRPQFVKLEFETNEYSILVQMKSGRDKNLLAACPQHDSRVTRPGFVVKLIIEVFLIRREDTRFVGSDV